MRWPGFLRRLFDTWDNRRNYRRWLGYGAASTGVLVNLDRAMAVSTFARCLQILAQDVACLSLKLYWREGDAGKREARDHPDWPLWTLRPCPKYTRPRWIAPLVTNLYTHGNAYREIVPRPPVGGRPAYEGLYPIDPGLIEWKQWRRDGRVIYDYQHPDEGLKELDDRQVLHFRGFSTDGMAGISAVRLLKNTLGLAISAEDFVAAVYRNGIAPRGVLEYPGVLGDDDYAALKSDWQSRHGGDSQQGFAVLDRGLKWQDTKAATPEEAELLESRKQLRADIAGFMGVPLHRLNDLEKASYNNVEHLGIEYVVYTMTPLLVPIEQEINAALYADGNPFVEFQIESLLRGDVAGRAQFYKELFYLGVLTINEIRRKENLNPIGEPGDLHWMQLNLAPLEEARKPISQRQGELLKRIKAAQEDLLQRTLEGIQGLTAPSSPAQFDLRPLWSDAARRIVAREVDGLNRAIARYLDGKSDLHGFVDWAERFYNEQRAYFVETLQSLADVAGLNGRLDKAADAYISEARHAISDNLLETSALRAMVAGWATTRPEQIVRSLT